MNSCHPAGMSFQEMFTSIPVNISWKDIPAGSTPGSTVGSMQRLVAPECWIHVWYSLDPDTWKLGHKVDHMILWDHHNPKQKCRVPCLYPGKNEKTAWRFILRKEVRFVKTYLIEYEDVETMVFNLESETAGTWVSLLQVLPLVKPGGNGGCWIAFGGCSFLLWCQGYFFVFLE